MKICDSLCTVCWVNIQVIPVVCVGWRWIIKTKFGLGDFECSTQDSHLPRKVLEMNSETWFPDRLISDRCVNSRFNILLNCKRKKGKMLSVSTERTPGRNYGTTFKHYLTSSSIYIFNYSVKSVGGHILFSVPFSLQLIRVRIIILHYQWEGHHLVMPLNYPPATKFTVLLHWITFFRAAVFLALVCKN